MANEIGSKQFTSVVVRDRPGRRVAIRIAVVVALVITAVASYWLGGYRIFSDYRQLKADHERLQAVLKDTEAKLEEASQQLANQKLGASVDQQALEEVRATVSEHKQTINRLNEEISFYKGLMAPTDRERGLGIRSWEIYPGKEPGRYQYKLVMQQLAVKHNLLIGSVTVTLVGRMGDKEQSFTLNALSDEVGDRSIRLRFKYFQYIDGELQLPEGFVVDRVDIVAHASKPNAATVEKHYGWVVQVAGA